MLTINYEDSPQQFDALLEQVEAGAQFTVLRDGRPYVQILPIDPSEAEAPNDSHPPTNVAGESGDSQAE